MFYVLQIVSLPLLTHLKMMRKETSFPGIRCPIVRLDGRKIPPDELRKQSVDAAGSPVASSCWKMSPTAMKRF